MFSTWFDAPPVRQQRKRSRSSPRRDDRRQLTRRLVLEGLEERRLLTFVPAVDYTVGASPQAIVSAHVNNDTILDLAVANYSDSTVTILLGNGDGTFSEDPALKFVTGDFPLSIAVGDLDGDGNLDLATANAYDVSVLMGNGDGTFDAPTSHSVIYYPTSVAVGDFTGDGNLDLGVTSNYYYYYSGYEGYATVLMGDGAGGFSGAENAIELGWGNFTAATAANLDGVGADELLTVNSYYGHYNGSIVIVTADADGMPAISDVLATGTDPVALAVGDADGDGDADIVTADGYYYNSVSVLLGDGAGGFGASRSYPAGSNPTSVAIGNFTGDDLPDIAVANSYSASIGVLYGTGEGAFSVVVPFATNPSVWNIAAGDFNNDSWLDLAALNGGASTVSVLLNDKTWPPPPPALSINDVTVIEGNTGTTTAEFTVTRSGDLSNASTVSYNTVNGDALASSDYVAVLNGLLTFAPGVATRTISILVNGDVKDEFNQGFYVKLSSASGAVITDDTGFALIEDNDPLPTISIVPTLSAKEGHNNHITMFNFAVTLSAPSEKGVQVNYATANGTATIVDGDYISVSSLLYFAPGITSQTISVAVKGDKNKESNETFFVNLTTAVNGTIGVGQSRGEILDDDTPAGGKGKP